MPKSDVSNLRARVARIIDPNAPNPSRDVSLFNLHRSTRAIREIGDWMVEKHCSGCANMLFAQLEREILADRDKSQPLDPPAGVPLPERIAKAMAWGDWDVNDDAGPFWIEQAETAIAIIANWSDELFLQGRGELYSIISEHLRAQMMSMTEPVDETGNDSVDSGSSVRG